MKKCIYLQVKRGKILDCAEKPVIVKIRICFVLLAFITASSAAEKIYLCFAISMFHTNQFNFARSNYRGSGAGIVSPR